MAEATRDTAILLAAHNTLGIASFYGGEFEAALTHLERGIELYDPGAHSPNRSSALRLILDSGVSCMVHAAWTLWALGYPARAAARMREALALSRSIDHPFSLAHACRSAAAFHHCLRRARRHPGAGRAESPCRPNMASAPSAWRRTSTSAGARRSGTSRGRPGVDASVGGRCREIRAECLIPNYLGWLAEVYGRIGRSSRRTGSGERGIGRGDGSGNHYWTAELHRLRGTLAASEEDAESSFLEAIAIARRQSAKSLELRAATDLVGCGPARERAEGLRPAGRGPRLVHGRIRHRRSRGRERAARGAPSEL